MPILQRMLRAEVHRFLAILARHGLEPLELKHSGGDDLWRVRIAVEPATPRMDQPMLSEAERNILDAAGAVPVSLKLLARKAGYKNTSYFRSKIANLLRLNLLRRTPEGLSLTT